MKPSSSPARAQRPVLTGGHYGLLAICFLVLALYGSLVPFQYVSLPWNEALDRFRALPYLNLGIESRSDWVANILLFIPLTFLTMAAVCVDRPWAVGLAAALVVLPASVGLTLAIEFVQLCFPPRTTSLNDVLAESIGGLLGVLTWLLLGQRATEWWRRLWTGLRERGLASHLLPAYLVALVLIHVMPLDLTISPVEVYHKYRDGRIRLLPFSDGGTVFTVIHKGFWNCVYFAPVGVLLASLPDPAWRQRRHWPRVLSIGLIVAAGIEFLQLFVFTRYCTTNDILTGSLAVLAGWWAVIAWRERASSMRGRQGLLNGRTAVWWGLLGVWLAIAMFATWSPFDFVVNPGQAVGRLCEVRLVPFLDYYAGTDYNAFDQLLHKTLLYLPLGALLSVGLPGDRRGRQGPVVLAVGLAVATVLEAGQLFLPGRFASLTDILVEGTSTWLGYHGVLRLRAAQRGEIVPEGRNRAFCG